MQAFPRFSNSRIAEEWVLGRKARNSDGTFWTDGRDIYSYGLLIGFTLDSQKVSGNYTAIKNKDINPCFISVTTSRHQSYVSQRADKIMDLSIHHS